MDITELLAFSARQGASDLHLSAGLPPMIRVDGDVRRINLPAFEHKQVHALIYDIMNDKQRKDFEEFLETDFSFEVPGVARFRVNAFNQNRGAGAVFRTIPSKVLSMEELGMGEVFKKITDVPRGLVLVTGPTGSGKTTTLYASLGLLNEGSRSILTVEDPVEYALPGIGQTPVNPRAGLTFASGLRAILRQDPDVIMIGEIRDVETAGIAVQASLTGHLVLSTLHTNSALGAITRLRDMGVEPFLLASSLKGVLAQRLVRRLCGCAAWRPLRPAEQALLPGLAGLERLREPQGCAACNGSGYRGRLGLYEFVALDAELAELIYRGAGEGEMARLLEGRRATLAEGALARLAAGETSLAEVLRAVHQ